jgi:hypothetical protein
MGCLYSVCDPNPDFHLELAISQERVFHLEHLIRQAESEVHSIYKGFRDRDKHTKYVTNKLARYISAYSDLRQKSVIKDEELAQSTLAYNSLWQKTHIKDQNLSDVISQLEIRCTHLEKFHIECSTRSRTNEENWKQQNTDLAIKSSRLEIELQHYKKNPD